MPIHVVIPPQESLDEEVRAIVAPSRYTGAADIALAEKLAVWEGRK